MARTSRRTSVFTESLIREMSRVAARYGAINLSQGFPDWDPPPALVPAGMSVFLSIYLSFYYRCFHIVLSFLPSICRASSAVVQARRLVS